MGKQFEFNVCDNNGYIEYKEYENYEEYLRGVTK